MIPALSYMIAAYIITRMLELLFKDDSKPFVQVFAGITLVVCVFAVVATIAAQRNAADALRQVLP